MKDRTLIRLFIFMLYGAIVGQPDDLVAQDAAHNPYRNQIRKILAHGEETNQVVIPGTNDWLFFLPELKAISSDPFWGPSAAASSRSSNSKFADPLAPILDFHEQLQQAGIDLLLVPVPAKSAVYPEYLIPEKEVPGVLPQTDGVHAEFYRILAAQGVQVLDLMPAFAKQRNQEPLYCRTDSHWSGAGARLAAQQIAERVKTYPWFAQVNGQSKLDLKTCPIESNTIQITGDLAALSDGKMSTRESVKIYQVNWKSAGVTAPIGMDQQSPILVLGDSHTLVFHDPQLFAADAGVADHLVYGLALKLDLIGVRGSGANAARISWRRRSNPLQGKKLVIWCFSVREFTENTEGWKKIPLRSKK